MKVGNHFIMIVPNRNFSGKYFFSRRILKFEKRSEYVSDEEILNLLMGFVRLIKKSAEVKVEEKYFREIMLLKKQINLLKSCPEK